MVRPTRRGRMRALLTSEEIEGTYDGDDVDFDSGVFTDTIARDQWKQPVRVATTANVTIATALNAGDTIDGVTLADGDRVLVKSQSTASQNGIYVAGTTPERAADMDDDLEVRGAIVYVIAGTTNGGKAFRVTNTAATVVDTDAISWTEFGGSTSIPAGTYELATEGGQSVIMAHGNLGATETFDPTDGNVHTGTLNADCTFTLNAPAGTGAATLELVLTQDGTGGWDITWPGSVTLVGTLDTTASTVSRVILETLDGGTSWAAYVVGGGGSALTVKDEGSSLDTAVTSIDFVGAGVTATNTGHAVTVTIPSSVTVDAVSALGFVGPILISDAPSTPLVFADLIQNEAQDDLVYADL